MLRRRCSQLLLGSAPRRGARISALGCFHGARRARGSPRRGPARAGRLRQPFWVTCVLSNALSACRARRRAAPPITPPCLLVVRRTQPRERSAQAVAARCRPAQLQPPTAALNCGWRHSLTHRPTHCTLRRQRAQRHRACGRGVDRRRALCVFFTPAPVACRRPALTCAPAKHARSVLLDNYNYGGAGWGTSSAPDYYTASGNICATGSNQSPINVAPAATTTVQRTMPALSVNYGVATAWSMEVTGALRAPPPHDAFLLACPCRSDQRMLRAQ